ncbi:MAG: hypothetical protein JOZ69_06680 [Myxococcales bacterium]|nr:hypothetical protein [Myxococcales bacterium]
MVYEDVVVLVPGFLGFSRIGGFYYFADRVSATLRSSLEARRRRRIPVVPTCALPTDRLAKRQEKLMQAVQNICDRIPGVERLHLMGHSAGGVDAQLLTCDRPLAKPRWTAEEQRLRAKIKSVVGLAAPHWGTCLADAPLAQLLADPAQVLAGDPSAQLRLIPSAARQVFDLARLVARDASGGEIVPALLSHLGDSAKFLWEILGRRGLIDDLRPRAMQATRAHWARGPVLQRSFVSVVTNRQAGDPFFRDLSALTADVSLSPADAVINTAIAHLNERARAAIRSGPAVPAFDERANDGVVNSARQLVDPGDPDELAGIVVGDHADVLGHYDRQDMFVEGRPLNLGLFHSGAAFGDDQFYELWGRVAEALSEAIPT